MEYTQEQLEKLKKFVTDPEWHLMEELIKSYIEPLVDINNLSLEDDAISVKGEAKAKIQIYNLLTKLLSDLKLVATGGKVSETNSYE